jgi:hypothetical protein
LAVTTQENTQPELRKQTSSLGPTLNCINHENQCNEKG